VATNQYNDSAADLETIPAGTVLYRILAANATYGANSYHPNPPPLDDPLQGRFDPTDPALGGHLYVATSVAGAVAEGVLRNIKIPQSRLVRRIWLRNKKLAFMRLHEDVDVAALYGSHVAKLNLDVSLLQGDSTKYSQTRRVATAVMLNTTGAQGIRYPCRNHEQEPALMFVSRTPQAVLTITRELNILTNDEGRDLVLQTLDTTFELKYAGPPW
jgi:hypothetical protein